MNLQKELELMAEYWQQYRAMQQELISVRSRKPARPNIKIATDLLNRITVHTQMIDQQAQRIADFKNKPKDGICLIIDERHRHVTYLEYDADRDDKYVNDELAIAAAVYAADETSARVVAPNGSDAWPLAPAADKRARLDRLQKLVICGALCAAEIDRLLREYARKEVKA